MFLKDDALSLLVFRESSPLRQDLKPSSTCLSQQLQTQRSPNLLQTEKELRTQRYAISQAIYFASANDGTVGEFIAGYFVVRHIRKEQSIVRPRPRWIKKGSVLDIYSLN